MTAPLRPAWRTAFVAAAICVCLAELLATHLPGDRLPHVGASDKTLHAIAYFALAGTFWATLASWGLPRRKRLGLLLAVAPLYAALDEITQPWFGRYSEPRDWLADMAGTAAAAIVLELVLLAGTRSRPGSRENRPT